MQKENDVIWMPHEDLKLMEGRSCDVLTKVLVVNSSKIHRYMNHGRGALANLKVCGPYFISGAPRVAFLANRDILAGEELLWDYGADSRYSPHWMKGERKIKCKNKLQLPKSQVSQSC